MKERERTKNKIIFIDRARIEDVPIKRYNKHERKKNAFVRKPHAIINLWNNESVCLFVCAICAIQWLIKSMFFWMLCLIFSCVYISLNLACKFNFFKITARLFTILSWNWNFIRKFPELISYVSAQFHERLWLLGFSFVRNQNSNSKQNKIHGSY